MLGQNHAGLYQMQVVHFGGVDRRKRAGQQIRLLLVVALQTNAIARPYHSLQQTGGVARLDDLAVRQLRAGLDPGIARLPTGLPIRHRRGSAVAPS